MSPASRVLLVAGARPQFVKAAMLGRALSDDLDSPPWLLHTGQHYDDNLSAVFFEELGIPKPDFHFDVRLSRHGAQTSRMLENVENILLEHQPRCVIVIGDTNTTLAGALAAAKIGVPVVHVEAGLRSFDRSMPEEINRVLTDHMSDLLFAPTDAAVTNLDREGITQGVFRVGDVLYDAALAFAEPALRSSRVLEQLELKPSGYMLSTVHREASTSCSKTLKAIVEGLVALAKTLPVVLPLHPRTRNALTTYNLLDEAVRNLQVIEPVGFLDMVALEQQALHIVTDSGGIQKEAFFFRVPCSTLRHETEWVELVELGWNRLVPPVDGPSVVAGVLAHLEAGPPEPNLAGSPAPYGNGDAAKKMSQIVCRRYL